MMDELREYLARNKYKLPYHWIRDPLHRDSLPYFGYLQVILKELPSPPSIILDAGCGDGRIAAELILRGYNITGIDYLKLPILYAKTMVPEGTFFVADLRKDLVRIRGLHKEQFDAVLMIEVFEHIPPEDCQILLSNINNVLKSEGILIISAPSKLLPTSKLHYRHFSKDEFKKEIEVAGFQILRIIYQHRVSYLTNFLFSDFAERFLNNQWFQPILLKRLRRFFYMKYANTINDELHCGRFIAVAKR